MRVRICITCMHVADYVLHMELPTLLRLSEGVGNVAAPTAACCCCCFSNCCMLLLPQQRFALNTSKQTHTHVDMNTQADAAACSDPRKATHKSWHTAVNSLCCVVSKQHERLITQNTCFMRSMQPPDHPASPHAPSETASCSLNRPLAFRNTLHATF